MQLQDGHRRRLQALAAAQNGNQNTATNSVESREPSYSTTVNQQKSANVSTSASGAARMKVISKKLITLSTKKVQGRNAAAAGLRTENVPSNVAGLSHLNPDSKSVSATRPAALNLNFNVATNVVGAQPIPVVATVKNNNHHHSSALSRFNASNNGTTVSFLIKQ